MTSPKPFRESFGSWIRRGRSRGPSLREQREGRIIKTKALIERLKIDVPPLGVKWRDNMILYYGRVLKELEASLEETTERHANGTGRNLHRRSSRD